MPHRSLSSLCLLTALAISGTALAQPQNPPADTPAAQPPVWTPPEPGSPGGPPPSGPPPPAPGYPPPVYAPPGYPPPPPPGQPQPGARARRGVLVMPFLGVHSFQGATGKGSSPGLRLGTMVGGRLGEMFSINGEIGIDVLNLDNIPSDVDVTAVSLDLALSPLVHVRNGAIEFVAGPKLGFWAGHLEAKSGGATATQSVSGNLFGLNLGLFTNVSESLTVGGLLSFDIRTIEHRCIQNPGESEVCGDASGTANKVLGITAAALF